MQASRLGLMGLFLSGSCLLARILEVPAEYSTIQAAIEASQPSDTILVSPGVYHEHLVMKPGIQVRSKGSDEPGALGLKRAETTILTGDGENDNLPGVVMASDSTLDGFTVTGIGSFDEVRWQQHWGEQGRNQVEEELDPPGIAAIIIKGLICRIANNIIHDNGHTGIAIEGTEEAICSPHVSNNHCYRNMGAGIASTKGSSATILENRCFENLHAGIGQDNASPLVLKNDCYRNVRAGIGIRHGASPIVRGNRCYRNQRAGIGIRSGDATRPVIENNDCFENGMAGIGCRQEAAPVIRGNRCYHNELAGIGCSEKARPLIIDNHCYQNQAAGIGSEAAFPTLIGNRLEKNQTAGIGIAEQSKAFMAGNHCVENKLVALGVRDNSQAILKGNLLARTGGMPPIVAILDQSDVVAIDNDIHGGGVAGVLLKGQLVAHGNRLKGNGGGRGVAIAQDAHATLEDNDITGYRTAVDDQR